MYVDDCRIKGVVNLVLRDEQGRVKQHKTIRNAVTEYGLSHIIGRMMDPAQDLDAAHIIPRMMSHMAIGTGATAANTVDRVLEEEEGSRVQLLKDLSLQSEYPTFTVSFADGTDSQGSAFFGGATGSAVVKTIASTANREDIRVGMHVTGTGVPATTTVLSLSTAAGVTSVTLSNGLTQYASPLTLTFQYVGVKPVISGTVASFGLAGTANELGVDRGHIGGFYDPNDRTAPPFFGDAEDAPVGFVQFGTAVDGVFQGKLVGSSISKDNGTTPEGYPTNENDYGVVETPVDTVASPGVAPTAVPGTKKAGTRVVFVATFKASNPVDENTAVTEAGIFNKFTPDADAIFDTTKNLTGTLVTTTTGGTVAINKAGHTKKAITQSMLCRTTFNVVNKASQDTLQITWSVQLAGTAN